MTKYKPVGEPDIPLWKFYLAGIGWKLTESPWVRCAPGGRRLETWSFRNWIFSRNLEEVEE